MGIRFLCPNGHKLNVKSFLAGKKGVCPHCGARMRIPRESDPALRKASDPPPGSQAAETDLDDVSDVEEAGQRELVGAGVAVADVGTARLNGTTTSSGPAVATPASYVAEPDPLDEAPNAVWYVRPPSGGQYGPAKSDVMKRWVIEGRVTADTYVWREGWADWKTAGTVLPSLKSHAAPGSSPAIVTNSSSATAVAVQPAVKTAIARSVTAQTADAPGSVLLLGKNPEAAGELGAPAAGTRAAPVRRKSSSTAAVAMIVLGLMALVLTVALVLVLRQ